MLLVVGMPRSGTTWLSKILDSHPEVLYRNEPDSVWRTKSIPPFNGPPYDSHQLDIATDYLRTLREVHTIKVVGTLPLFPKSYFSKPMFYLHRMLVLGVKLGERLPLLKARLNKAPLPEFMRRKAQPLIVIKSVIALGRIGLFMSACPNLKAILIVRHPCGHVASVLRGIRMRKFEASVPITEDMGIYRELSELSYARQCGIDFAAFTGMSPIERLVWRWAITNSLAMEALTDDPRARIIRYEDLCDDPVSVSHRLFDFAGLDWNEQTESFVNASTHSSGSERYFQVFRDPKAAANKWRQELTPDDIDQVLRIAGQMPAGRLFSNDQPAI